jgi:hypothetical protein
MATLKAIAVTTPIAFGAMDANGNTGTSDTISTITNTGNVAIDMQVDGLGTVNGDGLAMTCTIGTVPIANEKYDTTASVTYASKAYSLSDDPTLVPSFNIIKATSVTQSTDDIYWGIAAPSTVSGSCAGVIIFAPV